jgi:tyrosinase
MDRFDSSPLPLSPAIGRGEFKAAQLIFYDVDHSGPSFRALAFLNSPEADAGTPLVADSGYAGHFTIFGHGGCVGDEGHCKVPEVQKDPFDKRPLHALTPQTKIVDVTDALQRVCADEGADHEHLQVTVLPVLPSKEGAKLGDVLFFSAMRLVTFGSSWLA